jgi:tetratricopeptide (TPR) repeat protein
MTSIGSRVTLAPLVLGLSVVLALLVKPVQDKVAARLGEQTVVTDQLYFGSPAGVKKMALGYEGLLADLYWMRTIQYYGRREEAARRPVRYKNLGALLDITTTLDPDLMDAYHAGSIFLAEAEPLGAGQPREAIRLLDKGIAHDPLEWRLYYDKGFVYYLFLRDFKSAGVVWLAASKLPTAPPWMEGLAASALSKGGAMETAKSLWERQYRESSRADIRENAKNHVVSIQVAEDLWTLEYFIKKYQERTGVYPRKLEDLVQAGWFRRLPSDPLGTPYQYDPDDGRVRLSPETKVRYLDLPESYREDFLKRLASTYR